MLLSGFSMHSHELMVTFTAAAALGLCLFVLAKYLRTSAIVLLLIGGVLFGPQGLGIVNPDALGDGLGTIVSLAVAIVLFEGGLTLELRGYRTASKEIFSILTVGVLVTFVGAAILLRLIFEFDWALCFLASSLVIVTGPTVIGPLLQRIRVTEKLHHILHWEGVLIDPIGVFIALLCFEFYISTDGGASLAVKDFVLRFAVGTGLGVVFGYSLSFLLKADWIHKGHINKFVLAMAMLNFTLADLVVAESGLLSVTIAGFVLGSRKPPQLRGIVHYNHELKDFLIGLLFVLLAANLDLASFVDYGWKLVLVVAGMMILVRPLNIFLSMRSSPLTLKEKTFLSWFAPRGIVAASMASVFALDLGRRGVPNAVFLETFTYSVIVGTVIVQGFTAGFLGKWLGVIRPPSTGWIIVGAHALGRRIGKFFTERGLHVVLIDQNAREVRAAERMGLIAISEDALQINPNSHDALYTCGNLLALTANPDRNRMLCRRWSELLEGDHLYRWEKAGYESTAYEHLLAGKKVWENFPLDRWMVDDGEDPPLRVLGRGDSEHPLASNVLFSARGASVNPEPTSTQKKEDEVWLVYDPPAGQQDYTLPLKPNNVVFTEQNDLKELYREMLVHLQKQNIPGINPEEMLEDIWKREEDYTSLLANGVALPHTWSPTLKRATLMVARPTTTVRSPFAEGPIEIVFMLLSPVGEAKEHLEHLSCIARLIGTDAQRRRILEATDPIELYQIVVSS